MGWASGSPIVGEIIETIDELVSNYQTRVEVYKRIIEIFEDADCDTLDECLDEDSPAFKEAYNSIHPNHSDFNEFEEEYDD